jgi:peptidyl-prolyl cis-trans isomerase B (cyclophilin B)
MARSNHPDSAGSQFFIMHQKSAHLDGQYAAFGKVIEGMDVVDEIANSQTNRQDRPNQEQKIQAMSVDLNGYDFQSPRIIEL